MPLAPPVTTTTLPFTCMARPSDLVLGQNQIEHGRVMARRAEQHEQMPDHVLEAEPLPCVKDYTESVEQATGKDEPERKARQGGEAGVVGDHTAPAHGEIEADRQPLEAPRKKRLQDD